MHAAFKRLFLRFGGHELTVCWACIVLYVAIPLAYLCEHWRLSRSGQSFGGGRQVSDVRPGGRVCTDTSRRVHQGGAGCSPCRPGALRVPAVWVW